MNIKTAVNIMAQGYTGSDMTDLQMLNLDEARHLVIRDIWAHVETPLDIADDAFGDWVTNGYFEYCNTTLDAESQIAEAARQWDSLTRDHDNQQEAD